MRRLWAKFLAKVSPWHRGYDRGWDDGVHESLRTIEQLLEECPDQFISRIDVYKVGIRLKAEIRPKKPVG